MNLRDIRGYMIVCTHCQAKNSVDSAFCKSCGREVLEADREIARAENAKLIAEGYTLLADGRTEEAELVARAGIEADSKAGAAYSLLGMCFERRDDIVSALECYETVVELNPDSSLDKIKVTQLRNVLSRRSDEEPVSNRKGALIAAFSCVVLVGAIGALAAVLTRPVDAQAITKDEKPKMVADSGQGFGQIPNEYTNVPQGKQFDVQQNGQGQIQGDPNQTQNQQGQGQTAPNYNTPNSNRNFPPIPNNANNGNGGLSNVDNRQNPSEGYEPVQIGIVPREQEPTKPPENVSKPAQDDPGPSNNTTANQTPPTKPSGSISITPANGGVRPPNGGGQIIDEDPKTSNGNGLKALVRTANEQMLTNNYEGAARSLEQAKSRGGDNGSLNKKLALCYEKMGKRNDAIQSYRNAKKHLESSAGNDPTAKSQLESVNQALKNLGG